MKILGVMLLVAVSAGAGTLVSNVNPNGVANCTILAQNCTGTTVGPQFTITLPWVVTFVATYQNDGYGSSGQTPGPIGFIDVSDNTIFSWAPDPSSTAAYWLAHLNAVLPPGTYRVWSSNPTSWSYNTATGFADSGSTQHIGMAQAEGEPVPEPGSLLLLSAGLLALSIRRYRA
ncbi:MAG: PEP-CTERM sorting domain-containing protein [Bryobacterales bacterium]|nr:PEP-CTERM sorting domain-containing protein [Bryobacterales bacterium]